MHHVLHVLSGHNEVKLHCNKNVQRMTSFSLLNSSHTCDGMKKSASSCQTSTTLGIWVRASERRDNKHIERQASRSRNTRPIPVSTQTYRKSEIDTSAGLIMSYLMFGLQ